MMAHHWTCFVKVAGLGSVAIFLKVHGSNYSFQVLFGVMGTESGWLAKDSTVPYWRRNWSIDFRDQLLLCTYYTIIL
jgi:hypothetical protein